MDAANRNTWLCITAALVICAFAVVGAAWVIVGPVIPARTLTGVRGKTQAEVRYILGEPSEIQAGGDWTYDRWPTQGWVTIGFDERGRVISINDEQAIPGLWEEPSSWDENTPAKSPDARQMWIESITNDNVAEVQVRNPPRID